MAPKQQPELERILDEMGRVRKNRRDMKWSDGSAGSGKDVDDPIR